MSTRHASIALIWGFLCDVTQRTGVPRRWRNHARRSFRSTAAFLPFCSRRDACFHANDRLPVCGNPAMLAPGKIGCISVRYNAQLYTRNVWKKRRNIGKSVDCFILTITKMWFFCEKLHDYHWNLLIVNGYIPTDIIKM